MLGFNSIPLKGNLQAKVTRIPTAKLSWRVKNSLRWGYIWGAITVALAKAFNKITGLPVIFSELYAVHTDKYGNKTNYGLVSRRVVTTAGVNYLAAYWQGGASNIQSLKYAGCGTGSTAEAIGDTALVTESTTALNPDSTRATCTMTNPSGNVVRMVGTLTFDASAGIQEHGIFSQSATGGGTLWDRSVFTVINVVSGDSIQFTYDLTFTAGG